MLKTISKFMKNSALFLLEDNKKDYHKSIVNKITPDKFVEDDIFEESHLIANIINICEENNNVKTVNKNINISDITSMAKEIIKTNTITLEPNYIICSLDTLPLFTSNRDFDKNRLINMMGRTCYAGKYMNMDVFNSSALNNGQILYGVNNIICPGVVTFTNEEGKICNKIANKDNFILIKITR